MAHVLINSGVGVKRCLHIRQPTAFNSLSPPYRATRVELRPSAARMARLMSGFVKQPWNPETLLCQGLQVQTLKPAREPTMQDMRDAIVVLLAGGQGERLWPLPTARAKPPLPFRAFYPLLSNTLPPP